MVLRETDLRAALGIVAEFGDFRDTQSLRAGVLAGLRSLIPADAVAYNEINTRDCGACAVVDPPEAMFAGSEEVLARYGAQNPLLAHAIEQPHTRALKVSDFVARRAFRRTEIYNYLFRPVGLEYQMACGLPASPGLVVGISLNRSGRDFSERDRALLDLLRPHLVQAHERAAERELGDAALTALATALDGGARAAILMAADGTIQAASPRARSWLEEYFPSARHPDALPPRLAAWRHRHLQPTNDPESAGGRSPLEVRRGPRTLTVEHVRKTRTGNDLLVLEERDRTPAQRLRRLGLTPRQTQVLQLVGRGSSDKEIARRLGITEHTVGKHLEHIFTRLGVTTRTAAAAAAWKITSELD